MKRWKVFCLQSQMQIKLKSFVSSFQNDFKDKKNSQLFFFLIPVMTYV